MKRSRSERRHHLDRMKAKARLVAKSQFLPWDSEEFRANWIKNRVKRANNLKACSCWMCSNQRRLYGPPPQEARALAYWRQDLEDAA